MVVDPVTRNICVGAIQSNDGMGSEKMRAERKNRSNIEYCYRHNIQLW